MNVHTNIFHKREYVYFINELASLINSSRQFLPGSSFLCHPQPYMLTYPSSFLSPCLHCCFLANLTLIKLLGTPGKNGSDGYEGVKRRERVHIREFVWLEKKSLIDCVCWFVWSLFILIWFGLAEIELPYFLVQFNGITDR